MKRSTIISLLALAVITMILMIFVLRFGEEVRLKEVPRPVQLREEKLPAAAVLPAEVPQQPALVEKLPSFIEITSSGFSPTIIHVKAGEQFTFINRDTEPHWPVMIRGESCIDSRCSVLTSQYQGSEKCDKRCNFYSLIVSTSDGESYTVRPRRGSYSCAGALEWKIVGGMPDHCIGEKALVPIRIVMKEPQRIISENIVILQKGESSTVTHPTIPSCTLALTVDEVYELCS